MDFKASFARTKDTGFTLVELAIALMIIGLLLGGVLKGQELIENAKVTAAVRDVKAYDAAIMIFSTSYNKYPGDIVNPSSRLPNCTITPCSQSGNGDGLIGGSSLEYEYYNFFPHLNKAGLISTMPGHPTAYSVYSLPPEFEEHSTFPPFYAEGNRISVQSNTAGTITGAYGFPAKAITYHPNPYTTAPVRFMAGIDSKIDDGKPLTGDMFMQSAGLGCVNIADNTYRQNTPTTPCGRAMIQRW